MFGRRGVLFEALEHFFKGFDRFFGFIALFFGFDGLFIFGGLAHFFLEALNPTLNIHESHFTGKEGVTSRTDVDFDICLGGAGNKGIAATAGDSTVIMPDWVD